MACQAEDRDEDVIVGATSYAKLRCLVRLQGCHPIPFAALKAVHKWQMKRPNQNACAPLDIHALPCACGPLLNTPPFDVACSCWK